MKRVFKRLEEYGLVWVGAVVSAMIIAAMVVLGSSESATAAAKKETAKAAKKAPAPAPKAEVKPKPPKKQTYLELLGSDPPRNGILTGQLILHFSGKIGLPVNQACLNVTPPIDYVVTAQEKDLIVQFTNLNTQQFCVVDITPNGLLHSVTGKTPNMETPPVHLCTKPFAATGLSYSLNNSGFSRFLLQFDAPIESSAIAGKLQVTDANGQAVETRDAGYQGEGVLAVEFPDSTALPVTFRLPAGTPRNASNDFATDAPFEVTYPDATGVAVETPEWIPLDGNTERIRLRFSSPVSSASVERYVSLRTEPDKEEIEYSITTSFGETTHDIRFDSEDAGVKKVLLTIEAGLPDTKMSVVPQELSFSLKRPPRSLIVENRWWSEEGVKGIELHCDLNTRITPEKFKDYLSFSPAVENIEVYSDYGSTLGVRGDFRSNTEYTLQVKEGLASDDGMFVAKNGISQQLENTPYTRGLRFGFEGKIYFPKRTSGKMALNALNVKDATVKLHRIFPENVVWSLNFIEDGETWADVPEQYAREVASTKIAFQDRPDAKLTEVVDLAALLPPDARGVYVIEVTPSFNNPARKLVVWTDIGALAHWRDDDVVVFAHDLFSLAPLVNAKATVFSTKAQKLGEAMTDAAGIARLSNLDVSYGKPRYVLIETENDCTFVELTSRTDDPVAYEDYMPLYDRSAYDGFMYSDRDLYRPGETVHAHWIVRSNYGDAVGAVPLKFRLRNPKGNEILVQKVTLSELGTGGLDVATQKDYMTGKYTMELWVPEASSPMATKTINVEDFVPNRIEASVALTNKNWLPGVEQPIDVTVKHLFGSPAVDKKCEVMVVMEQGELVSEKWKGFLFGNDDEIKSDVRSLGEEQTDADGKVAFSYTPVSDVKYTCPMKTTVRAVVSEGAGRAVNAWADALYLPADVCLGLRAESSGVDGENVKVEVAAIAPNEEPAALAKATVTLERLEWHYSVRRYEGSNSPHWTQEYVKVDSREVALANGTGSVEIPIGGYGGFRLKVSAPETPQFSAISFYKYWRNIELVRKPRASLLKMTLNKEKYQVGEEAELRIDSPFDGTAMVVVQGEKILNVFTAPIEASVGTVKVPVTADCYPNAWFEVTVVHKNAAGNKGLYPYSSFGMAKLPLTDPKRALTVNYPGLPEDIRPAQEVPVVVETLDSAGAPVQAEVTLAAVDDGIHLILGYDNPDPTSWFARDRRPDYRRAHYYDKVAYDFDASPIGGDLLRKRLGKDKIAPDENWIKPVALWSGAVMTGPDGRATILLQVPEFNGRLRLVTVAVSPVATGAAAAPLYVRRPYMLRTTMPRFALPGDAFTCTASLFNTTDAPCKALVSWKAGGALAGEGSQTLDVPAQGEVAARGQFTASAVVGQGNIDWTAAFTDAAGAPLETASQPAALPVLPPAAYRTDHELVVLQPGESRTFTNTTFAEDGMFDMKVNVSANPLTQLQKSLRWLVGYPYGCVEQTTSKCLPMFLLRTCGPALKGSSVEAANIATYLQAGIDRLYGMQTPSGGLAYWPGGTEVYPYGTVYAAHFLTLARMDPALNVPERGFVALQDYLRDLIKDQRSDPSTYYQRAYAVYVLALSGDLKAIESIESFDHVSIPRSGRLWLAAALAINTRDLERVKKYLAEAPVNDYTVHETSGTLNSDLRTTAIEVLAGVEINPNDTELAQKVDLLVQRALDTSWHHTTQETAFLTAALAKYLKPAEGDVVALAGTIESDGKVTAVEREEITEVTHAGPGASVAVHNTGSMRMFVNVFRSGNPLAAEQQAESAGIEVKRIIRDGDGNEITDGQFKHGETYLVELQLTPAVNTENVIVADVQPAGFEIENPRLDANLLKGLELDDPVTPEYLEIRDDRLVVSFRTLESGLSRFYYMVRAVTAGEFQQPPTVAECMYKPQVRGNTALGRVSIGDE